jgi:hypothetical protein
MMCHAAPRMMSTTMGHPWVSTSMTHAPHHMHFPPYTLHSLLTFVLGNPVSSQTDRNGTHDVVDANITISHIMSKLQFIDF